MRKQPKSQDWFSFTAQATEGTAKLEIFGPIGGGWFYDEAAVTGKAIAEKLDALPEDVKTIKVLVNSQGGSVFDAVHIANALRRQREEFGRNIEVEIEALAASAATIITSAGSSVKMPRNALFMVHMPMGFAEGPQSTMLKVAEGLERAARAIVNTYRWISKLKAKDLRALMEATTWLDADEALEKGFITEVVEPIKATAMFQGGLDSLNVPSKYRGQVESLFRNCNGVYAGAEFADLANQAIDQRVEDEGLTRDEVLDELVEATSETYETIEQILSGEVECPTASTVTGFVATLPITQEQADTALEADGCTDNQEEDDDTEEDDTEEDDDTADDKVGDETVARTATPTNSLPAKKRVPGGKMKDEKNTEKVTAEKSRITGINAAAEKAIKAGMPADEVRAQAAEAVENDTKLETFRSAMLDALADWSEKLGPQANSRNISMGEDEHDKRVAGIQAALWHRSGVTDTIRAAARKRPDDVAFQNLSFDPGEFRGLSLMDHARDTLERDRAGSSKGLGKMDLAGRFLAAAGQQTTSDFPIALENALHKTLLAAYAIAPDGWRLFCKVGSVSDFRESPRYTRGYLSRLDEVKESGEYNNKTAPDAEKQAQQAKTYGNIIALSRQAIINDDMGIFDDMAMMAGRAAALSIEMGVFDLLNLNSGLGPNMSDGNPLYDASHANIGAGSGLSVAGIDADRVVMANQTDVSGSEVLDLRPAVLVLPVGLGGEARVINDSQYDNDGSKFQKPNKVQGLFNNIVDTPRIVGSTTRRYLFTDPTTYPVLEVAFLDGEQSPFMDMVDGWRVDGAEWKVRHDFGVAAIDYRGTVTNAGA